MENKIPIKTTFLAKNNVIIDGLFKLPAFLSEERYHYIHEHLHKYLLIVRLKFGKIYKVDQFYTIWKVQCNSYSYHQSSCVSFKLSMSKFSLLQGTVTMKYAYKFQLGPL